MVELAFSIFRAHCSAAPQPPNSVNVDQRLPALRVITYLRPPGVDSFLETVLLALEHFVSLSHPDATKERCIFHESSGDFSYFIMTQLDSDALSKPISEKQHKTLDLHSKAFAGASTRWSVPQKDAYGLIDAADRFNYLSLCDRPFRIFTDHISLLFSVLRMNSSNYIIEQITGHLNIWADMITRWDAPSVSLVTVRRKKFRLELHNPFPPPISLFPLFMR